MSCKIIYNKVSPALINKGEFVLHIALFGATGRVGTVFLQKALEEGHTVTALVRDVTKLKAHPNLTVVVGDAKVYEDIEQTAEKADMILSSLSTDQTTTLTESMQHMIDVCLKLQIERIVSIGTAGILDSRLEPGKLRYDSVESRRAKKFAAEEHAKTFYMLQKTTLDWTLVCPTALPMGERTGDYRVEADLLPEEGQRISVYDTADFTYKVMTDHLFSKKRVGIAY